MVCWFLNRILAVKIAGFWSAIALNLIRSISKELNDFLKNMLLPQGSKPIVWEMSLLKTSDR